MSRVVYLGSMLGSMSLGSDMQNGFNPMERMRLGGIDVIDLDTYDQRNIHEASGWVIGQRQLRLCFAGLRTGAEAKLLW